MKRISLLDYPEYHNAIKKYTEIQEEFASVEKEIVHVNGLLVPSKGTDKLTQEAEYFLSGGAAVKDNNTSNHLDRLETLYHRRGVLARAMELQKKTISEIRFRLSAEICEKLRPQYAGLILEIANLAKRLGEVMEKEEKFRETLKLEDIAFSGHIPAVIFRGPGLLKDENSRINIFLREARSEGYI